MKLLYMIFAASYRIPRLDRHDAFDQHRRSGIRDWYKREDDSHRLGEFHQPTLRIFANDPDGALVFYTVVDKFRRHHIGPTNHSRSEWAELKIKTKTRVSPWHESWNFDFLEAYDSGLSPSDAAQEAHDFWWQQVLDESWT